MRLNKLVADRSGLSRRAADKAIQTGQVLVNGQPVIDPALQVNEQAELRLKDRILTKQSFFTLAYNKPRGVTSTMHDQHAAVTIGNVLRRNQFESKQEIPKDQLRAIVPAGRLDAQSRGLVILTNDGQLQDKIIHPKYRIVKKYEVIIRTTAVNIDELCGQVEAGLSDDGDFIQVDNCRPLEQTNDHIKLLVSLHTGKNHELRRLFRQLGHPLLDVYRTSIGHLSLQNLRLRPGEIKSLTTSQIELLTS